MPSPASRQSLRAPPRAFEALRGLRAESVSAPCVEREFAVRVLACVTLDDGWREAVLHVLAAGDTAPDRSGGRQRVAAAVANLRKQHLWGVLSDDEFQEGHEALERERRALEPRASAVVSTPNLDRAATLLRDLPTLWTHPGVRVEQRRELAREVFSEVRLRKGILVSVTPRPVYRPLFAYALWRQGDAGGVRSPRVCRRANGFAYFSCKAGVHVA